MDGLPRDDGAAVDPLLVLVREHEAALALQHFPERGRVLDLGSGSGLLAAYFDRKGYSVVALDLPGGIRPGQSMWAVETFDGVNIPYPDGAFDVVFTSHVLEHVGPLQPLLAETARVLRAGGVAVHIMPTPSWRMGSNVAHYIWLARLGLSWLLRPSHAGAGPPAARPAEPSGRGLAHRFYRALVPHAHGCRGNFLTEAVLFSRFCWSRTFSRAGFHLVRRVPSDLFFTGYQIPGRSCPLAVRQRLAALLGAGSAVYVLTHGPEPPGGPAAAPGVRCPPRAQAPEDASAQKTPEAVR